MSVLRSVGAVVAGFSATALLSVGTDAVMHGTGVFPEGRMSDTLFVLPAVYRALFTVGGGYITARLAPSRPMVHVWVLAGFGLLGGGSPAWPRRSPRRTWGPFGTPSQSPLRRSHASGWVGGGARGFESAREAAVGSPATRTLALPLRLSVRTHPLHGAALALDA